MRLELSAIPHHPGPFTGATGRTGLVRALVSATVPARVATGNRRGPVPGPDTFRVQDTYLGFLFGPDCLSEMQGPHEPSGVGPLRLAR